MSVPAGDAEKGKKVIRVLSYVLIHDYHNFLWYACSGKWRFCPKVADDVVYFNSENRVYDWLVHMRIIKDKIQCLKKFFLNFKFQRYTLKNIECFSYLKPNKISS